MTHIQKFQIGEKVLLLSDQHVATVLEFSPATGKYRLDVPGWISEHNGKKVQYWYSDEHFHSGEKATPPAPPAPKKPKPLSSAVPAETNDPFVFGPDDGRYFVGYNVDHLGEDGHWGMRTKIICEPAGYPTFERAERALREYQEAQS